MRCFDNHLFSTLENCDGEFGYNAACFGSFLSLYTTISKLGRDEGDHRVGRVLSFFSSRKNWDSPNPSPAGECPPTDSGGRAHSLAREGLGEPQFRRGDIHCGTLYIYVYFVGDGKKAFFNYF
jgi:hypothetical protein